MSPLDALILGLVEGLTEYLPISSTGHLIIASALLGLEAEPELRHAVNAFNIVMQGGAILAVLGLYRRRVLDMIRGLLGRDADGFRLAINLIIAFLPAAVLGVLLAEIIEEKLFHVGPVVAALAVGGLWMIWLDWWRKRDTSPDPEAPHSVAEVGRTIHELTPARALAIGLLQCIAMWPGTSRSMMTIAGGVMVGLKPRDAAEFSFLLGLPTLGGACVYKLLMNLRDAQATGGPSMIETLGWTSIVIGLVVAFVSAALAIKWLVRFLTRHGLAIFGVYRLVLSAVILILATQGIIALNSDDPPTPVEDAEVLESDADPG